jgi:trigger factor
MKIETLNQVRRKIELTIPAREVDAVIEKVVARYQSQTSRKGFRKGKVLLKSIESRFRNEIMAQAGELLYNQHAGAVLKKAKLSPLNRFQVSAAGPIERGKDLTFSFVVEVLPELDLPEYKGMKIRQKTPTITDAKVDELVAAYQEEFSTLEPITEPRGPEKGEVAEIVFMADGDFASLFTSGDTPFQMTMGRDFFDSFETLIYTLKPGETRTETLDFPEDFHILEMAGQSVAVQVTLKVIYQKTLPQVDEAFAMKVANVSSVEQMHENIKQRQLARLEREYNQEAKQRLVKNLLEKIDVPLAPSLVRHHINKAVASHFKPLKAAGVPWEEAKKQLPALEKKQKPFAEKAAKVQLLMMCIAMKEKITLSEEIVGKRIYELAARDKKDVKDFIIQAQKSGRFSQIKKDLMVEQVIDFLYNHACITPAA